jgi:hypothetical protein
MLRHIISVSLAITACASLISTQANAATLTMEPVGTLQRNPGDSIQFELALNPDDGKVVQFWDILITFVDGRELSYRGILDRVSPFKIFTTKTILGRLLFDVRQPVKDGRGDFQISVIYWEPPYSSLTKTEGIKGNFHDVQPVPEPVPEPLTIFGTATGLGCGALFKRKFSKKTVA